MNFKYYLKQVKRKRIQKPLLCLHCSGLTTNQWRHLKHVLQNSSKTLYQPALFLEQPTSQQHRVKNPLSFVESSFSPMSNAVTLSNLAGSLCYLYSIDLDKKAQLQQLLDSGLFILLYGEITEPLNHVDIHYSLSLNKESVFMQFIHALTLTASNFTRQFNHKV